MVAVLAAVPAAVAPLFDGAESFFQMLSSAAGVCGWWTTSFLRWERRTGRTLLWVPSLWRRRDRTQFVNVPARAAGRAARATGAG